MSRITVAKPRLVIASYDHAILITYLVLCFIGLFFMLDISSVGSSMSFFYKHLAFMLLSFAGMSFMFRVVDIQNLKRWTIPLLLASIVMLVLVLLIGNKVNGARRAFVFPIVHISLQPSEIARVALVLFFAYVLDRRKRYIADTGLVGFFTHFWVLIPPVIMVFGLVFVEPHLSTLIILAGSLLGMLFVANIRFKTLAIIVLGIMVLLYGALNFKKHDYRGGRLDIYKKYSAVCKVVGLKPDPARDTDDYHIRESLTAMASGSLTGTGAANGKAKYYYLPEASTDYIYAVIGEEYGFIGALFVFVLYLFLFYRTMKISLEQDDLFFQLAGMGLAMNLFFNTLVNIGVAISALPSTGVTLPFISYGGTSFLVNSLAIGCLLNISAKRREIW
jgi:cell division protein FtsW (lipid II flippase)